MISKFLPNVNEADTSLIKKNDVQYKCTSLLTITSWSIVNKDCKRCRDKCPAITLLSITMTGVKKEVRLCSFSRTSKSFECSSSLETLKKLPGLNNKGKVCYQYRIHNPIIIMSTDLHKLIVNKTKNIKNMFHYQMMC